MALCDESNDQQSLLINRQSSDLSCLRFLAISPPMRHSAISSLPSAVEWSHRLIQDRVLPGDWVVDATAGNGHDTAFLAALVGETGRVFAFDVQEGAIAATQARLAAAGLSGRCQLFHAGHETLHTRLPAEAQGNLGAVMLNLGYLPGHDKACITRSATTLQALAAALAWLRPGGIVTLVVYPGHAGGDSEAAEVAVALQALDSAVWEVQQIRPANRRRRAPECWAAVKIGTEIGSGLSASSETKKAAGIRQPFE